MCGARIWIYGSVGRAILGWRRKLYSFSEVTSIRLLLYVGIKVVDEWQLSLDYARGR